MTTSNHHEAFLLGEWLVEPLDGRLQCGERTVRVEPKVMEVLICLANHEGSVVTKDTLQEKVWNGRIVTDDAIQRCISQLRRAFSDSPAAPRYIETIPKRGYRLLKLPQPAITNSSPTIDRKLQPIVDIDDSNHWLQGKINVGVTRSGFGIALAVTILGALLLIPLNGGLNGNGNPAVSSAEHSAFDRAKVFYDRRDQESNEIAIAILEDAANERPLSARSYYLLANAYSHKYARWTRDSHDSSNALAAALNAVQHDDSDPQAHRALGVARSFLGDYQGALKALETSLAINPDQWVTLSNIGRIYYKLRHYEVAKNYFERALEVSPDNQYLFKKLGAVNLRMNQLDEAEKWYGNILAVNSNNDYAISKLADIHLLRGDFSVAKRQCAPILTRSTDNEYCSLVYGKALIAAGEFNAAYSHFQNQTLNEPKLATLFEAYQLVAEIKTGRRQNADQDIIEFMAGIYEDGFLSRNDRDEIQGALSRVVL